jgi:very-short-patch-repair endonuclease
MLWARLRALRGEGPTFRRQHAIGPYVADFYSSAARLVVEVDGARHTEDAQLAHDERRDSYLREQGYIVLRVPAGEIMRSADDVAQGVVEAAIAQCRGKR